VQQPPRPGFWHRSTTWSAIVGVLSAVGGMAVTVAKVSGLDPHARMICELIEAASFSLAGIAGSLGSVFARQGGVEAAAHVDQKVEDVAAAAAAAPPAPPPGDRRQWPPAQTVLEVLKDDQTSSVGEPVIK